MSAHSYAAELPAINDKAIHEAKVGRNNCFIAPNCGTICTLRESELSGYENELQSSADHVINEGDMAIEAFSGNSAAPENAEMVVPADLDILLASAERQLDAFMKAVTNSFGPKEGRLAADDWLQVLESREELPGTTVDYWRSITLATASRLAKRLSAASVV